MSNMHTGCLQVRWRSWATLWAQTCQSMWPRCCQCCSGSCGVMTRATGAMLPTVPASSANMHPSKCRTRLVSCYRWEDGVTFCVWCKLQVAKLLSVVTQHGSMTASCRQHAVALLTWHGMLAWLCIECHLVSVLVLTVMAFVC